MIRNPEVMMTESRSSVGEDVKDEKYTKRTRQQLARLRQALLVFGASVVFMMYTWSVLANSTREESLMSLKNQQPSDGGEHRHGGRPRNPMKQPNRPVQDRKQQGEGLFDRVLGRNPKLLQFRADLEDMNQRIIHNIDKGIRWINADFLPPLGPQIDRPLVEFDARKQRRRIKSHKEFMAVKRLAHGIVMDWEKEVDSVDLSKGPLVDFTKHQYQYPEKLYELPTLGEYPKLKPMREIMERWPQDDIDHPPTPFVEGLIHFDFTNPKDLEAAILFRDAKLPFKLIHIPEVVGAGKKWTDDYLIQHFDEGTRTTRRAQGTCQESPDNFFAFYTAGAWSVEEMGIPPTRNNDWTFAKWVEHARYADATGLSPHHPHFYFQAGVDKEERHQDKSHWTFISRDLPSFSSPTETFFVFEPEFQKGIQCRFGERGVTAATHFDSGRNMVAMMKGAKRYVLSPPKECSKLGIVTGKGNPIFRHSMLNFGHLNEMSNTDMPSGEREWLERSADALAIDTVLKAGEVLYIPSHWFHYITSLQTSAQCNVRSGVDVEGDSFFGGQAEATSLCDAY